MNRTRWLALVLSVTGALAFALALSRSGAPALDCAPEAVHLDDAGVARCGPGLPLPAGAALTAGQRLDLNAAPAEDLALIPGLGPAAAQALVEARARLGRFDDWGQVDAVSGIGPARLEALRRLTWLGSSDGGA